MIERTEDVEFLRSIFTHPRVWPWVSEDGQRPQDYQPLIHPAVHYLRNGDAGVISFRPLNSVLYECHVAMLPGVRSDAFAQAAASWMWAHTPAQKLIVNVPSCNRAAVAYARRAGFTQEGRITRAFLRNGQLHDIVVMGRSKNA